MSFPDSLVLQTESNKNSDDMANLHLISELYASRDKKSEQKCEVLFREELESSDTKSAASHEWLSALNRTPAGNRTQI